MTLDDPLGDGPPDREDLGQEGGKDYEDEEMEKGGKDESEEGEELGWEEKYADDFEPMTNNDRENEWEEVGKKGRPTPSEPTACEGNQVKTSNKQGGRTEAGERAKATMATSGGTKGLARNSLGPNENQHEKMKAMFPKTTPGGQILWGDDDDEDEDESQTIQPMTYTKRDRQGNVVTVNANEYMENDEPIEALPKHQIFARMEIYVKKGEEGEGAKVNHAEKIKNMVGYMLQMDDSLTVLPARGGRFGMEDIEDFPKTYDRLENFFKIEKEEYKAGGGRLVVGMRLSSRKRLGFFKKNGTELMTYMREHDIWLVAHKHKTMIVQRVGFIVGKCPDHTNKHVYEMALTDELEKFMNKDKDEDEKCKAPTFEVVKSKIIHPIKDENGRVTRKMHTFALEIKCEKNRTRFLRDLIFEAGPDAARFGRFIPYAMKWKETTYAQAVSSQNTFLHESLMIPIFGLHEDVLKEKIEGKTIMQHALDATVKGKSFNGRDIDIHPIKAFERTNRTKTLGKWKMMTKKSLEEQASVTFDRIVKARGSRTKAHRKAAETGQCYSYGIRRNNVKLQLGDTMENCAQDIDNWLQQGESTGFVDEPPQKVGGFSLIFDKTDFPELQGNEETETPSRKNAWQKRDDTREIATVGGRSETGTDNGSQAMSHATVQTVLTQVFDQMDKRMSEMAEKNKQSTDRLIGQMNRNNERNAKGLGKMQRMCEQQQAITMTLTVAMAGLLSTMGPAAESIAKQMEPMLQSYKELAATEENNEEEEEEEDEKENDNEEQEDETILMKEGGKQTNKDQSTTITNDETTADTEDRATPTAGPTAVNELKAQLDFTLKQVEKQTDMDTSMSSRRKRPTEERSTNSDNRSRGTTKVVVTPGPTPARIEMRNRRGQERGANQGRDNRSSSKHEVQRSRSRSKERKKDPLMESLDPSHGGLVHTANYREADRQNQGGGPRKQD
jgi:hypothetical protein